MSIDDLSEIQQAFLTEAEDLLVSFEKALLTVEKGSDPLRAIDELFRVAHNLKGSASAVGFKDLSKYAHRVESFLLRIKSGEVEFSANAVTFLLRCSDQFMKSHAALVANQSAQIAIERTLTEDLDQTTACKLDGNPECVAQCRARVCKKGVEQDLHPAPVAEAVVVAESASSAAPSAVAQPGKGSETIRVQLEKIENLLNDIGELVILQTVMTQNRLDLPSLLMRKTVMQMDKIIRSAQETSMSLRMVPLSTLFTKLDRIVRDSSKALGKQVELVLSGEDEELDKTMYERISDPLVHIVRNSVDHGLELPSERVACGKTASGTIHVSAYHRGSHVVIEVRDDGKGLDPDRIKKKAVEKGLLAPDAEISPEKAMELIFLPGFSTKDQVSDLSGRGVGMDVVRRNVEAVHGRVEIDSQVGKGTRLRMLLPMSLAITDGVVVRSNGEMYVIPRSQILEYHRPASGEIQSMAGQTRFLRMRGSNVPLLDLGELMDARRKPEKTESGAKKNRSTVVVLESAKFEKVGILVDGIVRQQQVVIKQLSKELQGLSGIIGGAILGDGRVALIIDAQDLADKNLKDLHKGAA